jgi:hypothetical protein
MVGYWDGAHVGLLMVFTPLSQWPVVYGFMQRGCIGSAIGPWHACLARVCCACVLLDAAPCCCHLVLLRVLQVRPVETGSVALSQVVTEEQLVERSEAFENAVTGRDRTALQASSRWQSLSAVCTVCNCVHSAPGC